MRTRARCGPGRRAEDFAASLVTYEVNDRDDILAYDRDRAYARTEPYPDIIASYNAGRGDLASFVTVTGTPPPLPSIADIDGDGGVAVGDLLVLLGAWGPCAGCPADIDCSGAVDIGDLLILLAEWG